MATGGEHSYAASADRAAVRKEARRQLAARHRLQNRIAKSRDAHKRAREKAAACRQERTKEALAGANRKRSQGGRVVAQPVAPTDDGAAGHGGRTNRQAARLNPVSEKRKVENVEYERNVRIWNQREDRRCEFVGPNNSRCPSPAGSRPHHRSGRGTRELRVNPRYFVGLCWLHHHYVDGHRTEAEKMVPPLFVRIR